MMRNFEAAVWERSMVDPSLSQIQIHCPRELLHSGQQANKLRNEASCVCIQHPADLLLWADTKANCLRSEEVNCFLREDGQGLPDCILTVERFVKNSVPQKNVSKISTK